MYMEQMLSLIQKYKRYSIYNCFTFHCAKNKFEIK